MTKATRTLQEQQHQSNDHINKSHMKNNTKYKTMTGVTIVCQKHQNQTMTETTIASHK